MSASQEITGFLTLSKDSKTLIDNKQHTLFIDEATGTGWVHPWHLDDVQVPLTWQEVEPLMSDFENPATYFNVSFRAADVDKTYTGQAFITQIKQDGIYINLQGANDLAS
jgi:hypothetical protein